MIIIFSRILSLVITPIDICFSWITDFDNAIVGLIPSILFIFTLYTVTRLLLKPLIGHASSDLAKKARSKNK